jgi:hypothetical protein
MARSAASAMPSAALRLGQGARDRQGDDARQRPHSPRSSERAPSALIARSDARDQGADAVDQRRAQLGLPPRADAMLQHLADARLVLIERAGHAMNAEQPNAFNAAVSSADEMVPGRLPLPADARLAAGDAPMICRGAWRISPPGTACDSDRGRDRAAACCSACCCLGPRPSRRMAGPPRTRPASPPEA